MTGPRSVPAYPVAHGRCRHCGRKKPTWTPWAIIDAFRKHNAKHGRAPFQYEWYTATPTTPAHSTVREVFGSWSAAAEAAGLPKPLRTNTRRVWTRSQAIAAVIEWKLKTGRLPRSHEWVYQTDWRPSEKQVRRLFGTWNAVLEAAGFEPTMRKTRADDRRAA